MIISAIIIILIYCIDLLSFSLPVGQIDTHIVQLLFDRGCSLLFIHNVV